MSRPSMRSSWRHLLPAVAIALLAACAAPIEGDRAVQLAAQQAIALRPADVLLFGERHDAPEHHLIEGEIVQQLGARGRLAALAIEMADAGRSTEGLPRTADDAAVRDALGWEERGWPWADYAPAIMAAVRFGVPVLGANLPRARMREAMDDAKLDALVAPGAFAQQREAIREGHCNLLPDSQLTPMTRIQLARDRSMAQTVTRASRPERTVLLITGAGHARRDLGVPLHMLPETALKVVVAQVEQASDATDSGANRKTAATADLVLTTPALPPVDHCASLR